MGIQLSQLDNSIYGKDVVSVKKKDIALRDLSNVLPNDYATLVKTLYSNTTLPIDKIYFHTFVEDDKSAVEEGNIVYNLTKISGISLPLVADSNTGSYKDGFSCIFIAKASNDTGTIKINIDGIGQRPLIDDNGGTSFQPYTIKANVPYLIMFDTTYSSDGVVGAFRILIGNTSTGSTSIASVITQANHEFDFCGITYNSTTARWERARPEMGMAADAIAVKIDNNTFRAVVAGFVDLPASATGLVSDLQSGQTTFTAGDYYFLSHSILDTAGNITTDHRGKFCINRVDRALEQCMFKVVKVENLLRGIVMVTNTPNYNYLDTFQFNSFGGSGILDWEQINSLKNEISALVTRNTNLENSLVSLQNDYNNYKIESEISYIKSVNYIDITNTNQSITFTPVTLTVIDQASNITEWMPTNIGGEMTADAVALRIDINTIRIFNNGLISVPSTLASYCTDDGYTKNESGVLVSGSPQYFIVGQKYYVSPFVTGTFHKYEITGSIQQLAFKVLSKSSTEYKLMIQITDEIQMVR